MNRCVIDSGAFTELAQFGCYQHTPEEYAAEIARLRTVIIGNVLAAVSQDYMCEPHMLEKTGLTIAEHQRLTIERYDAILAAGTGGIYLMPVLQGYAPADYVSHIRQYGDRLKPGMWVGVGSVCKRNADSAAIEMVLEAIKQERPDLRLHGFGVKITALRSGLVRDLLATADSMAWSWAARKQGRGRDANDVREAIRFVRRIETMPIQGHLFARGTRP